MISSPKSGVHLEQAIKEKQSHLSYLEVLLGMEVEERERNTVARRIKEAHFPKVKTLEEFGFSDAPHIPVALVRNLAEGGYLLIPRQSRPSSNPTVRVKSHRRQ